MNEQWNEDIRRKMAQHEEPSPELSWDEIDRALADRRQHRATRIVPLYRYRRMVAAAVVALAVGGAGILFVTTARKDNTTAVNTAAVRMDNAQKATASLSQKESSSIRKDNVGLEEATAYTQNTTASISPKAAVSKRKANVGSEKAAVAALADSAAGNVAGQSDAEKASAKPQQEHRRQGTTDHEPRSYQYNSLFAEAGVPAKRAAAKSRMDVTAYMTNAVMGSNAVSAQPLMLASASPYGQYEEEMDGNGVMTTAPNGTEERRNVSHRQPVRIGVEVGFRLSERTTLTAGLAYSYLHSDIDRTIGDERSSTVQRLHYIGIPVGLNYSLWRNRNFNVYLSAGGMVERMISGNAVTKTATQDKATGSISEQITMKRLQFSAHAAAGVEWFVLPNAGLFVEPGASYHFNNGSGLSTIYADKPLNLNLSLGLRFGL